MVTEFTKLSISRRRSSSLLTSNFRKRQIQNVTSSRESMGFLISSWMIYSSISFFLSSNSSRRCFVDWLIIPIWIAFSIFSMPRSVSANCWRRAGSSLLSLPCKSITASAMYSTKSSFITFAIVALTTAFSNGSLRTLLCLALQVLFFLVFTQR